MKHFRYILLCLSLLAAVGLVVGCSCGKPQDETSASTPAETSTVGMNETSTQESGMQEPSSSPGDIYETGNGYQDSTDGMENGADSNGTGNGTDNGDGLMGDVTDGLDQMGEDISDAVDDVTDGTGTSRR